MLPRGQEIGYDAHKKAKGSKVYAAVIPASLPVAIDLGPGDEHESRRVFPLSIRIRVPGGQGTGQSGSMLIRKIQHTLLVMMYLAGRGVLQHASSREQTRRGDPAGSAYLTMKCTSGYEVASRDSLLG